MSEESDLEKTEPATPRRLEQAREEGDVPRSRELSTCAVLVAGGTGLWLAGHRAVGEVSGLLAGLLSFDRELAFDSNVLLDAIAARLGPLLLAFAPPMALLLAAGLFAPIAIGGWVVSAKGVQPKASRMNPLRGFRNMVSMPAAMELAKAIAKAALVGGVAVLLFRTRTDEVLSLAAEPVASGARHVADLVWWTFIALSAALVAIALVDVPFQLRQHARKLRMTRDEVRREAKEGEGDPQIKARIRTQQREMARRRMMAAVPKADVVVTNPTHYAVALSYVDGRMRAPRVVAKGADVLAARIREVAAEHGVPLLEAPALARALHRHTDIGDEIPAALYAAVAEVLAYVYQLRAHRAGRGPAPSLPDAIDVPAQLDPTTAAFEGARA